jgi:hypothetical protein
MALQRGDLVRQFAVTTLDGARFDYSDIWQRRNLLLIALAPTTSCVDSLYVSELTRRLEDLTALETKCVITSESVLDLPPAAVIIADRWSEIYFIRAGVGVADLPSVAEMMEWLRSIQHECPECQGEAR